MESKGCFIQGFLIIIGAWAVLQLENGENGTISIIILIVVAFLGILGMIFGRGSGGKDVPGAGSEEASGDI